LTKRKEEKKKKRFKKGKKWEKEKVPPVFSDWLVWEHSFHVLPGHLEQS
jgi:hypothetical protein